MLSTQNITEATGSLAKTLSPGKQQVKLNSITVSPLPYDQEAYNVYLNVEGPDLGADFEGFFIDKDNESKGRFKGQVSRVRLYPFPYKNGETKKGVPVDRDQSILRGLVHLATALDKRPQLDTIQANNILEFVDKASTVLSTGELLNVVLASKQYMKGEYVQNDLFIPMSKNGKVGYELASTPADKSKLMDFDEAVHIIKPKVSTPVESFGSTSTDSDFEF